MKRSQDMLEHVAKSMDAKSECAKALKFIQKKDIKTLTISELQRYISLISESKTKTLDFSDSEYGLPVDDIVHSDSEDEETEHLEILFNLINHPRSKITILNLSNCGIGNIKVLSRNEINIIFEAFAESNVVQLTLDYNPIGKLPEEILREVFERIFSNKNLRVLELVDIAFLKLSVASIKYPFDLIAVSNIEILRLSANQLGKLNAEKLQALFSGLRKSKVEVLMINDNELNLLSDADSSMKSNIE